MIKRIVVNDKMQKGYSYNLSEASGKNFHTDFKPELSPKEMLALGIFGGIYMRDCVKEFPKSWFAQAKFAKGKTKDPELNFFKINASKSLKVWRENGWIRDNDPRGWFQWYCRYYMGRRGEDDLWQIKRWKAFRRHIGQIKKNCSRGAMNCRPRQKQALLHWAYDSRKL
jgi:hypothetical protein